MNAQREDQILDRQRVQLDLVQRCWFQTAPEIFRIERTGKKVCRNPPVQLHDQMSAVSLKWEAMLRSDQDLCLARIDVRFGLITSGAQYLDGHRNVTRPDNYVQVDKTSER